MKEELKHFIYYNSPKKLQNFLLNINRKLPKNSWLNDLDALRRKELDILLSTVKETDPVYKKKILFYSIIPWQQGGVEHILSTSLRLRGHDVTSVICGGLLPDCEMHYYDYKRPDCELCVKNAKKYINAFGIAPLLSSDFLTKTDLKMACEKVKDLTEKQLYSLSHEGIPIGKIARFQMNVFYQTFLMSLDNIQIEQLRLFCESSILLTIISQRLLEHLKPDIVVLCNGKAFGYRPMFLSAQNKGIPVVTWEEHAFDNTMKFVFNHNCFAGEIHLEDVWEKEANRPLNPYELKKIDEYFLRWRKAEITPFAYHKNTNPEKQFLYSHLQIDEKTPIIACFPNMLRDTLAFDRDVGFDSQIDWLIEMVEHAQKRHDLNLIIHAHPAERCLPEKYGKYNRFFVCEEIRKTFSPLPSNVYLLEGDSPVNSYTIAESANVILVYSSTTGIEHAMTGRLVCVVGDVHYRNKGFTKDIYNPKELRDFLDSGPPFPRNISKNEIEYVKRYSYLWRFRHPITMPFYNPDNISWKIPSFNVLQKGGNLVIDRLCDCILSQKPFIDIMDDT